MSTVKDRKSFDLTEAERVKTRWQENTEELYKRGLNDLDNHDGVVTHHRDYLGHEDLFYSSSVYSCHLFLIYSAFAGSIQFLSFTEPIFA